MIQKALYFLGISCLSTSLLFSQTIEEKRESLKNNQVADHKHLKSSIQTQIQNKKKSLSQLYKEIEELVKNKENKAVESISLEIKSLVKELRDLESEWKELQIQGQELDQIIISKDHMDIFDFLYEYSSVDFIYLIPQEIRDIKLNISSKLSIPQASWESLVSIVLNENNIYIEEISPFIKKLRLKKEKPLSEFHLLHSIKQVELLPAGFRTGFFFPIPSHCLDKVIENIENTLNKEKARYFFLDSGLLVFAQAQEIVDFQHFIEFISLNTSEKSCKVFNTSPLSFEEFQQLVKSIFAKQEQRILSKVDVIPLKNKKETVLAVGLEEHLKIVEELLDRVKGHAQKEVEKKLFFLPCQHVDVQEIASIVDDFFRVMKKDYSTYKSVDTDRKNGSSNSYQDFIIDPKTNSIMGYCDESTKMSLQQLISRVDQPNLMVNIEILLFEKKIEDNNQIGLSHLAMGSLSSNTESKGFSLENGRNEAIHDIIFNKKALPNFPAIDLAYKFIMSQKNLQINANPSILTCNKKTASISIVDEISINTGYSNKGKLSKSYDRKEVGIKIEVTPVVQIKHGEDSDLYVTLVCNINFDAPKTVGDLPNISKRSIKNEVRIRSGETIILGGLKRETNEQMKGGLPLLGEIPGIGKLFSSEEKLIESTEMFICLTPKVVNDHYWKDKSKAIELKKKRPGDALELLEIIKEYKSQKQNHSAELTFLENDD
jgi:general secretion pathway protein D